MIIETKGSAVHPSGYRALALAREMRSFKDRKASWMIAYPFERLKEFETSLIFYE